MAEEMQKEIKTFLEKMTFPAAVVTSEDNGATRIAIYTDDARFLIGSGGEIITVLDSMLKKIIQRKFPQAPRFFIDVNDYRQKKIEFLREDAKNFAKLVRMYRREKVLDPMPSFERRVVHSALSEYPDIITESIGEEPKRRIVIKPNQN